MFLTLLAMASAVSQTAEQPQSVQARNGEFIFRHYPARAKAAGEQGIVQFSANVDDKGTVLGCKVIAGSGFERLDRETCDLIVEHARFKPALDSSGRAHAAVHTGQVNWRLPSGGIAPKMASVGGRPLDEVVCKRSPKTGSLIGSTRTCMTRAEWIAQADHNQADWADLQGRRGNSLCDRFGEDGQPWC